AAQLPFRLLPLQPMALLAVSVLLCPPSATASASSGELYDVRPDRSRAIPDRIRGRYGDGHDPVVPTQRRILRSSYRDSHPAVLLAPTPKTQTFGLESVISLAQLRQGSQACVRVIGSNCAIPFA